MKRFLLDAWYLARKDAWLLIRLRETLIWTFFMPVVFFYFLGLVNRGDGPDRPDALAVVTSPGAGFLGDELIHRLGAHDYRVKRPTEPGDLATYDRRLEIPGGFTASVLAGKPTALQFTRRGQGSGTDYDKVRLNRAVYSLLADLVVIRGRKQEPTLERFQGVAAEPHTLQLDTKLAGKRLRPPSGYDQSVPGTMVMFTLTVLFTSGAVSLTIERHHGILRRLAYTPMPRGAVVLGMWGARMSIGLVQLALALVLGRVMFGVHWGPNLPMICVVLFAYASLAASLAMLLGNFARTVPQAIGLGITSANLLAGLGGCWWPIEITPLWAQKFSLFLPTGWTMDAMHKLINFGSPASAVIPHVLASVVMALLTGLLLSKTFKFE